MTPTEIASTELAYFDPGDGRRIAYRRRLPSVGQPTILFLPGYASDMEGAKAEAIDAFCAARSLGRLRLDYSGTGSSGGDFAEGTLDRWLGEAVAAIDMLSDGPLIVAGSSMGGWLALHAALARPDRVKAVLGIAAAPDFTDWGYTQEEKQALIDSGRLERTNPYGPNPSVTHFAFWRSGEVHRLLYSPINLSIPVRLVHGEIDPDVPIGVPIRLMADLHSSDVQLRLIKGSGHRLSEPYEIHAILTELAFLVDRIA
ncbi:MAG: alpha/beta fold hydrolase [Sphingomonas sp.]|uniref:alpha/beta hydrolase n=1 Tax=Sphingomonas sp. TaxID=28214 RepID=UPI0017A20348|nr:alpha/beta fold hydrolase [Sphingomonas sp.]MBA3668264.1 alpha/beta fold hydrolase [Sphingomonas sp.]